MLWNKSDTGPLSIVVMPIICEFDGDMSSIVTAPIYVQQVFDAVKFNLRE
ncbi:MAG: hypothetical protein ACLRWH_15215 [Emergencia sp.]